MRSPLCLVLIAGLAAGGCHTSGYTIGAGVGVTAAGVLVTTDDPAPGATELGVAVAVFGGLMILYGLGQYVLENTSVD